MHVEASTLTSTSVGVGVVVGIIQNNSISEEEKREKENEMIEIILQSFRWQFPENQPLISVTNLTDLDTSNWL